MPLVRPPFRLLPAPTVLAAAVSMVLVGCADQAGGPTGPEASTLPAGAAAAAAAPLVWRTISAGDAHTCGVTRDDRAWCWGNNFVGQLGDGTSLGRVVPTLVTGGHRFRTVTVGRNFSCGITTDDLAWCWGNGPLGSGTVFTSNRPVPVSGGRRYATLQAGLDHVCGINLAGKAYCWGNNGSGQLGNFSRVSRATPVEVGGGKLTWRWINPGGLHTCGVTTDSRAYCWGRNVEGQLGGGTTQSARGSPVPVSGGLAFRNISAGHFHTCGVTTSDRAYCWGENVTGQLGDGTRTSHSQPRPVAGTRRYRNTSAAQFHSCALTLGGAGTCWGSNPRGELGDGTTTARLTPTLLPADLTLTQLSAGYSHGCGVTGEGRAWCWGANFNGQLGDGTTVNRLTPVRVADPT